jgi:hypothetical protein
MREGHREHHKAGLSRSLSERRRRFPLLAVSLAEVPAGEASPFVPPRGSWRPAAASVKGRCRRASELAVGEGIKNNKFKLAASTSKANWDPIAIF